MSRVADAEQVAQQRQLNYFDQGLLYLSDQYKRLPDVIKDKVLNSAACQVIGTVAYAAN